MMEVSARIVLPGDNVDPAELLPARAASGTDKKSKNPPPLRLGPGLRLLLPSGQVVPTVSGEIAVDRRKNLLWVESEGGRVSFFVHACFVFFFNHPHHTSRYSLKTRRCRPIFHFPHLI